MKKRKVFQIVFMAIMIVVTLAACQIFEEEELQPLPTRPEISSTESIETQPPPTETRQILLDTVSAPTQPPQKSPLGLGIPHMRAGDAVIISTIKMFSETRGWAIGGENDQGDHILNTVDGGDTWVDVTPPELSPNVGESKKRALAFFLDKTTAWATYYYRDSFNAPDTLVVWYTDDGGENWGASSPLERVSMEHYSPIFLHFIDRDTGWFMVAVGAGMSHQYTVAYKTQDGGGSWEVIHDPMNSVHLQACCKTGLVFADTQTGLITFEQGPYAEPYVEWTYDGGLTWEHETLQPLPSFPDMFANGYCNGHSPYMFSTQAALFALDCKNFNTGTIDYFIYQTQNGGTTWYGDEYPGGELYCFDADNCFALDYEIHKTTDGGATWDYVNSPDWDGQFSFVNWQLGWAVARNSGGILLMKTVDGGETWVGLAPVISEK